MKLAPILVLALLLSACRTTGPIEAGAAAAPVTLPPDYRSRAAVHLVADYVKDAIGPAEITPEPVHRAGLLGEGSSVVVRYPVRVHSLGQHMVATGWLLESMEKTETGMRCITVRRSVLLGGEATFQATRPKHDPRSCGDGETFVPYRELEASADRLRACRQKGEGNCLLWTNMPEAEARKLMRRP